MEKPKPERIPSIFIPPLCRKFNQTMTMYLEAVSCHDRSLIAKEKYIYPSVIWVWS